MNEIKPIIGIIYVDPPVSFNPLIGNINNKIPKIINIAGNDLAKHPVEI